MAALPAGGYAERALVRAWTAVEMPHDIPPADATALTNTYGTSHAALHHRARLQAGETLLVHAAAGGVGSAAVQLGVAAGATVIATVGSASKVPVARGLGARHVIDASATDVRAAVMDLTHGRGVDVAYDAVGGELGEITRRLIAWEGRLLVIGFAAGGIPTYPANHILVKNYSVIGLHWGAYVEHAGRDLLERTHADLMRLYRAGAIRPLIHGSVGLEQLPDALAAIERREVLGRLVVEPDRSRI
jgi:NADPH:quinone reductase-like Zn-dependent oxidoreductase